MELRPISRFRIVIFLLFIILFLTVVVSISIGAVTLSVKEIWSIVGYKMGLFGDSNWLIGTENIVWLIRVPRVLLAVVVGAGLAVAGTALQALVKNPLADTYILGISSGASVGAVLAIGLGAFAFVGPVAIQFGGFIGALTAFVLVYFLAHSEGRLTPWRLILAGIGIGYFFSGITSFITLTSKNRDLAGQVLSWTMGSMANASWFDLGIPTIVLLLSTIYLIFQARQLNTLILGDETATTLGLNVDQFRKHIFVVVALIIGVMVSVSGSIGFVGLMIPHIARLILGPDHRFVLPISAVTGSIFLVWIDVIARSAFAPIELPVGVITFLVGGPFFLFILWNSRKGKWNGRYEG